MSPRLIREEQSEDEMSEGGDDRTEVSKVLVAQIAALQQTLADREDQLEQQEQQILDQQEILNAAATNNKTVSFLFVDKSSLFHFSFLI